MWVVTGKQIKKALRGVKVEVTHRGNFRRKYRISGLTSQPTRELMYVFSDFRRLKFTFYKYPPLKWLSLFPLNSFPLDEQMNMKSVVDYFQEMYGFTIKYSHLPCLQVGSQRKLNYLPMEVIFAFNLIRLHYSILPFP